jgi:hypothetical protein
MLLAVYVSMQWDVDICDGKAQGKKGQHVQLVNFKPFLTTASSFLLIAFIFFCRHSSPLSPLLPTLPSPWSQFKTLKLPVSSSFHRLLPKSFEFSSFPAPCCFRGCVFCFVFTHSLIISPLLPTKQPLVGLQAAFSLPSSVLLQW